MLYPMISSYLNAVEYSDIIDKYDIATNKFSENKNSTLFEEAINYNNNLNTLSIIDAFTDPNKNESDVYSNILNIDGKGLMGYISIPKIDVRIPIYHGTSSKVLEKGVGHLEGSSFPIGGESTHAVLSAHRGLPSAKLFTDLDQLKLGDKFYIYILDKVFAYEVDNISIIEPSQTEGLQLQEGKDYVTLVTCTPYAINTHRLLVRGSQVEYIEEVAKTTPVEKKASNSDIILYIGLIVAFLLLIFVILRVRTMKKNLEEKNKKDLIQEEINSQNDIELI